MGSQKQQFKSQLQFSGYTISRPRRQKLGLTLVPLSISAVVVERTAYVHTTANALRLMAG